MADLSLTLTGDCGETLTLEHPSRWDGSLLMGIVDPMSSTGKPGVANIALTLGHLQQNQAVADRQHPCGVTVCSSADPYRAIAVLCGL